MEAGPTDTAVPPGDPGVDAPAVPEPAGTEVHDPRRAAAAAGAAVRPAAARPTSARAGRAARAPRGCLRPAAAGPSASGALVSGTGAPSSRPCRSQADAVGAVADWRRALRGLRVRRRPAGAGRGGHRRPTGTASACWSRRPSRWSWSPARPRPARRRPGAARLGRPGARLVVPRRPGRLPLSGRQAARDGADRARQVGRAPRAGRPSRRQPSAPASSSCTTTPAPGVARDDASTALPGWSRRTARTCSGGRRS